jgi:hypothetical protein
MTDDTRNQSLRTSEVSRLRQDYGEPRKAEIRGQQKIVSHREHRDHRERERA